MSNIDIEAIVGATVEKTAAAMAMKEAERKAAEEAAATKAAEEEAEKAAQSASIVTSVETGAEKLLAYVEAKLATKEGETFIIDLAGIGYHKLLGRGAVTTVLKVKAQHASAKAVEKVKAKGGEVTQ